MAIDEGIYELRSVLQTYMCVVGSGLTAVRGSNVYLYAWTDDNNFKWHLIDEGNGRWRLRNAANGLYMTLGSSTVEAGVNVRQWTSSTNKIQYWNVIDTGETMNIGGYDCKVVQFGSYGTDDGETYMLDVDHAMTANDTNIQIWTNNSGRPQKFVLRPQTPLSYEYPSPVGIGWSRNSDTNPYRTHADPSLTNLKLGWQMPSTWTPVDDRTYEWRVCSRLMSKKTSSWGSWSQWTQWATVDPVVRDEYCYDANGVDPSFSTATSKAKEVQAEVRCIADGLHGHVVSQVMRNIVDPTATLAFSTVNQNGIVVSVTSDYVPATYTITSLVADDTELLGRSVSTQVLGSSSTITVPWSGLNDIPLEGAAATATYTRGTDLFATIGGTRSASLTVSYGTAPLVAPTITLGNGRTLSVTHSAGVSAVYISNGSGVFGYKSGSRILYPLGRSYRCLVVLGDGKKYFTTLPRQNMRPAHAFNWNGGSFLLEYREGEPLSTDISVEREVETYKLNKREWESVHYQRTKSGSISATGALVGELSESTRKQLDALVEQGYVTYRSPFGLVANVAVTGYSLTEHDYWSEVTVNMTRVTN